MANTPISGLPYPTSGEAPNGPSQIQALATAVDPLVIPRKGSDAARNAMSVTAGQVISRTDSGDIETYFGGTWARVAGPLRSGKAWRTTGVASVAAANTYEKVGIDASRVTGGVTFDNADDSLTLPASGFWELSGRGYLSGGSGYTARFRLRRARAATADRDLVTSGVLRKVDTNDETEYFSDTLPLQLGDKIYMQTSISTTGAGVGYYGSDEANGIQLQVRYVGPLSGATPY